MPFSPLFIGEVSSTTTVPTMNCTHNAFSPLFIGDVSATESAALLDDVHCQRLSVPSSSGMSLRPRRHDSAVEEEPETFQSPLHRGCLCDSR